MPISRKSRPGATQKSPVLGIGIDRISASEMRAAIARSGYLLEGRVKATLEAEGFFAESNVPYRDPETGKTREIDLRAFDLLPRDLSETVAASELLGECENNAQPVAFFETRVALQHDAVKCMGLPFKISTPYGGWVQLTQHFQFEKFHHYWKVPTATQYCSFQRAGKHREAPWIAHHPNDQHESFYGVIAKATEFLSLRSALDEDLPVQLSLFYPILVLQGELYLAEGVGRSVRLRRADHVQYLRETFSDHAQTPYVVDVMTESFLPEFLRVVRKEGETFYQRMLEDMAVLQDSWRRIVREEKNAAIRF